MSLEIDPVSRRNNNCASYGRHTPTFKMTSRMDSSRASCLHVITFSHFGKNNFYKFTNPFHNDTILPPLPNTSHTSQCLDKILCRLLSRPREISTLTPQSTATTATSLPTTDTVLALQVSVGFLVLLGCRRLEHGKATVGTQCHGTGVAVRLHS